MKPLDQTAIRKQNIRKILILLSHYHSMTRQALSEHSGLSLMTVSNLVEQLRTHDILSFSTIPHTTPHATGRKAESIRLSGEKKAWLILELTRRKFTFRLLGFDLSPLAHGSAPASSSAFAESLQLFARQVRTRLDRELSGRELLGVAIISPDDYNGKNDNLIGRNLHPKLGCVGLKELFREHLGNYSYIADKEVKYAIRAFPLLLQHSAPYEVLYYLYIGENMGGALMLEGKILYGLNNASGDVSGMRTQQGESYEKLLCSTAFSAAVGLHTTRYDALCELALTDPELYRNTLISFIETAADLMTDIIRQHDPHKLVIDCPYALPYEDMFLCRLREGIRLRHDDPERVLPEISLVPYSAATVLSGAVHALQLEWLDQIIV